MIATDEDALICDLAETYHIYDYRQLPIHMVAAFSAGLRDDSRIKMILSGQKVSFDKLLRATVVDRLGILIWQKTKDGQKNRNRPQSIVELLTAELKERKEIAFESGKDFEEYRRQLLDLGGEN
ncbi:DUF5361 domain-containing protein [Streptococcus sp. KS 6]|jgi:hypothetical protein|uniref:DUF5361 domain-containing protein n=1 Tax=Streptococcus sp. KS 6 TaxID=2598457 RepID=UPI001781AB4A|nr:DUF5361 domain-containing protein [Streptococcus sp. KS 6]QOG25517.1 hypothetical protein FPL13_08590 [Streptococcus sp. KS 6]